MPADSGLRAARSSSARSSDSRKATRRTPSRAASDEASTRRSLTFSSSPDNEVIARPASEEEPNLYNAIVHWQEFGAPYGRAETHDMGESELSRLSAGTIPDYRLPDGGFEYHTGASRANSPAISLPTSTPPELKDPDRPIPKAHDPHNLPIERWAEIQDEQDSARVYPLFRPVFKRPRMGMWQGILRADYKQAILDMYRENNFAVPPNATEVIEGNFEALLCDADTGLWVRSLENARGGTAYDRPVDFSPKGASPVYDHLSQELRRERQRWYRDGSGGILSISSKNSFDRPPALRPWPGLPVEIGGDGNASSNSKAPSKKSSTESPPPIEQAGAMEPRPSVGSSNSSVSRAPPAQPNYQGALLARVMKNAAAKADAESKTSSGKAPATQALYSKSAATTGAQSQKVYTSTKKTLEPPTITARDSFRGPGGKVPGFLKPSKAAAQVVATDENVAGASTRKKASTHASKALKSAQDRDKKQKPSGGMQAGGRAA